MATVRFSQELKSTIIKIANSVFERQLDAAKNARPSDDWGMKIYNELFGQHTAALNNVPTFFFRTTTSLEVSKVGDQSANLKFNLPMSMPWPNEFPESELAKKAGYYGSEIDIKNNAVWGELYADVLRWKEGIAAVERKRDEFVSAVQKVIDAHVTLAPALKMWPPLWDLIPENTKEKHREIVERKRNDTVDELGVDLGSMTAAVTLSKITR